MSTEPLDFSPDEDLDDVEEFEEMPRRAAGGRPQARARYAQVEESESVLWPIVLGLSAVILLVAAFVVVSLIQGEANGMTEGLGEFFAKLGK